MIDTTLLGKLAGIISVLAYFPYIWAILKEKTKPNRASWVIWTVISGSIFFSYSSAGATDTIWVSAGYTIGSTIISLLSIKYGVGGWTKLDQRCLMAALVGFFLWWLSGSPLFALYISTSIDATASIPTIKKAYLDPLSEDKLAWSMFWLGSILNVLAVDKWKFVIYMYPIAIMLIISIIAPLVIWDRGIPKQKET